MRTILFTLAFTTAMGAMAQQGTAQPGKTLDEQAATRTEKMAVEYGLDATQVKRVQEINLAYAKSLLEVNTLKDEKAKEGRTKVLEENRDRDLQKVLTPAQYEKFVVQRKAEMAKQQEAKKQGTK
jgi:hypothetical protein